MEWKMESRIDSSASELVATCATTATSDPVWQSLVESIQPRLRDAVRRELACCGERRDPDLVDDLVQEVWCRLLSRDRRALASFRGADDRAARAYLRRVAASVTIDLLRAAGARKRRPPELRAFGVDEEARFDAGSGCCPERRLLARERLAHLLKLCREALGARASRDRLRIVRWGLLEGWPSREIARRLDGPWTVVAIDSLLFRVRRHLEKKGYRFPRRPGGLAA
jgi:RNA polymerase sigma factor (sigma-70 family)